MKEKTKKLYHNVTDLSGQRFNRLTIKSFSHINKGSYWVCQCDCGNLKTICSSDLKKKKGATTSCGCYVKENNSKLQKLRKGSKSPLWNPDRDFIKGKNKCAKFMYKQIQNLAHKKNGEHTNKILGFTRNELYRHLESKFDEHMSWQNYGTYWHIDHIIPVSYFIKNDILDPKVINALSNLQPLEAKANIRKGNKLI